MLFSLAYRMLGTVVDAEDIVQETFAMMGRIHQEHISNIKAYLCKMVTNRCLDHLKSAQKQREVYVGPWLPEPLVLQQDDDPLQEVISRDSLSIAYVTLMQQLTAVERGVFVLREVLQFDYSEIAEIVGKTEANCRKIFSRVRQKLAHEHPQQEVPYEENEKLLRGFITAIRRGDAQALLRFLSDDAVLYSDGGGKVRAALRPIYSRERVVAFLLGVAQKRAANIGLQIVNVNGSPGLLISEGSKYWSVFSYKLQGGQIAEIYLIMNPDKLRHLPQVPREDSDGSD
ncbi:RNA polymerase sigma-70 factor [Brevibacillus humidisoli]|uniref:RNA polymerase sigma-70 factor n=1 Tax=Brevibacillus humidisoli TaxID=2895522 RepID=UPI001E3CC74E|nr:RNA polymerase sigma-70 factor [Brevibacillus humidisoli]